jgi:anti-anti-sigma factor
MLPFNLSESDIWPGCREIEVQGELDLAISDRLRAALGRATAEGRHVLLDFGACEFVDSSGLAVLVQAQRELGRQGRQLLLYGVRGQVRRMLALTGLGESGLLVAENRDRALARSVPSDHGSVAVEDGGTASELVQLDGDLTLEAGGFRVSVDGGDRASHSSGSGTWAG